MEQIEGVAPLARIKGDRNRGLTRCSTPSARESMIQAICSSVPKVATVQMKLNFLPSRIRICGRPNCTFGLINDYRGFLASADAPQCSLVQEMGQLGFRPLAACLVKAGLAGSRRSISCAPSFCDCEAFSLAPTALFSSSLGQTPQGTDANISASAESAIQCERFWAYR
jgi:hypothetical protein